MTFEQTQYSNPTARPERVRILAEIPREVFNAIGAELCDVPDWHVQFIKRNPTGWPEGMFEVIEKHLGDVLELG